MRHAKKHNETPSVRQIILSTLAQHRLLASGILLSVCGAILTALVPPLVLGRIIDTLTLRTMPSLLLILLYFAMLALTGILESVREGLLTVCGQQITHALRSRLMAKFVRLSAEELNLQEPGAVVSRFVGDVDTVENLFTSGIISIFADACKILSILAVIWFRNKGLALIFLLLLPLLFAFTRHVQKNMLTAQIENRKAVSRASAHVPETLHNIRTIHVLGKERYMEQQYDRYIGDSYRAMERTNFYDAIYSPVILILNAIVVALVMLLSASGNPRVLTLFGMSAGTAVAVMNYISQIFSPVESLGMEIQTIQSAVAGIHRIQEFFGLPEKEPVEANASVSAASAKPETTNFHADMTGFPGRALRGISRRHLLLRREQAHPEPPESDCGDRRPADASRPHRSRKKYPVQAASGTLSAGFRAGPDPRRSGRLYPGGRPPKAFWLRGTILPYGSRNGSGSDYPV